MIQVSSIEQLKKLTKNNMQSFRMYLQGGLFSRKEIIYQKGHFKITNCIDGSMLSIDENQIQDDKITSIGKAIKLGGFYHEI